MIYLDNASTTIVDKDYKEIIEKYYYEEFFNPSAIHEGGLNVRKDFELARKRFADILGVNSSNIIFTSCATESNNLAVNSRVSNRENDEYMFSMFEHPSINSIAQKLESEGKKVIFFNPNDVEKFKSLINKNTRLIACMWVNNETGEIFDVENLSKIAKEINPKLHFHTDGVQGFVKLKINLGKTNIDSFSLSGHKCHSPKGVGVLYYKNISQVKPLLYGGGQENGYRSGTENVANIIVSSLICEDLFKRREKKFEYVSALREKFVENIKKTGLPVYFHHFNKTTPYIVNFSVLGVKSEVLLRMMSDDGVFVSAGSACSAKKRGNRILENMLLSKEIVDGNVRVSFSGKNTIEEIVEAVKIFQKNIRNLLNASV